MSFFKTYRWLGPLVLFSIGLIVLRIWHTGRMTFFFIPWNLFLAFVPLACSYASTHAKTEWSRWLYAGLWLLFFPNAMYIVTDLFHLHDRGNMPLWYDLLILFSAALNGILMGLISLYNIENMLRQKMHQYVVTTIVFVILICCGYGIYLGRYDRWNSWDIVTHPLMLLFDIKYDVVHPYRNRETWMLTVLFGVWMFLLYQYCKKLLSRQH